MKCICNKVIEPERTEFGLVVCKDCAFKGRSQEKYKGAMIFDHKTGGECQVMSGEDFADFRRLNPYGRYTGRGSGVHVKTRPTR
tara:strand:+ start:254 stop:505 length:252 start_codon:yes stop_codon:yes gene_type:complete